jgi:hypothetical protein
MDRKEFLRSAGLGLCCGAFIGIEADGNPGGQEPDAATQLQRDKEFTDNWLTDLLDTIETELDEKTKVKLLEGCGRGCYRRHQFKQDISAQGRNDMEKLLPAYRKVFGEKGVWQEGDAVHIRFNSKEHGCYCPVLRNRPPKSDDIHCNCTRATHQAIFENAFGRPFKVDLVESVRRGGDMCHLLVHLA